MTREVELNRRQPDGSSLREHLAAARRQGMELAAELEPLPLPDGAEYLVAWYGDLRSALGADLASPKPLSYTELDAWARRMEIDPTPTEVRLLFALDRAFITTMARAERA